MGSFFAILPLVSNRPHPTHPLPAMPKKEVMRIIRFGVVGGTGTLLNALMVWLLLTLGNRFFQLDPGAHGVATFAAFLTWIVVCGINYLLNAAWTFHSWPPLVETRPKVLSYGRLLVRLPTSASQLPPLSP